MVPAPKLNALVGADGACPKPAVGVLGCEPNDPD